MTATLRRCVSPAAAALVGAALLLTADSQAIITKPGQPAASTGGVSHVHGTSSTLNGSVQPHGLTTTYFFQYGPTVAYGSQTAPGTLPAGYARVAVGQTVVGLRLGEHYRLVAKNADGVGFGRDRTFSAKVLAPKFALQQEKTAPPTPYEGTYVLRGSLSGADDAFRKIMLQASRFPYLEPFESVGAVQTTSATGTFALRVPHITASTQFRVSTLDPRPLLSPIVTARVAVVVTLKVRTSAQKGFVRLYGTVTPAEVGVRVNFQLLKAIRPTRSERETQFATQFATKTKRGSQTKSRFSFITVVRRRGYYRAYVQLSKGPLVSGASPTVHLSAAPRKAKKH